MGAFAHGPDTLRLGDFEVPRLGFGAMRLPGPMVWGEPPDRARAKAVVRRALELGVRLVDTSWYYGPHVANRLIAEAIHPYPSDLLIATKLGGKRLPDKSWAAALRPEELRAGCEEDLRTLKIERCDLTHLRLIPSDVPFLESWDAMIELQRQGKIRHLALSNVGVEQLDLARAKAPVVCVQNLFSVAGARSPFPVGGHAEEPEKVLARCEELGIPFLPFFPLLVGGLAKVPALDAAAKARGATVAQLALAWLLRRSRVMLPIPGTSSLEHLEENWAAREIALSDAEAAELASAARA